MLKSAYMNAISILRDQRKSHLSELGELTNPILHGRDSIIPAAGVHASVKGLGVEMKGEMRGTGSAVPLVKNYPEGASDQQPV